MASAMRKIGVYLGLVDDDPFAGPYEDYAPRPEAVSSDNRVVRLPETAAVSTRSASSVATAESYSIHTIHPRSYNDARRVGEEFRVGNPVILNLTEMDDVDAKRIVDFAAGLVFGLHGTIERVTKKVFLLSPQNVDVRDAPAVQKARDGFFNQS